MNESVILARQLQAPRRIRLIEDLSPAFALYTTTEGVPELLTRLGTS
ncbi:hypothetical protein ABT009_40610 [Streptomyces sp. NPDC002896]